MGNPMLRFCGSSAHLLGCARTAAKPCFRWLIGLFCPTPFRSGGVALANTMARIIWALLVKGESIGKSRRLVGDRLIGATHRNFRA